MNVKKISRRKRSALVAAMALPLIFGFSTAAAEPEPVTVTDPEIKESTEPVPVDQPTIEQPADDKVDTSQKPDESATVDTPQKPADEPYRSQVAETLLDYMKQFEGKTIVDIEFEGASSVTAPTVRAAVLENVGDTFSGAAALRDRNALINTGYFYEAYQTFEVVPEGVIITFHVLENPILKDVVFTGNTIYTKEELDEMMTVKRGEILNNNTLHDNIAAIQEDYKREGFILMKVTDMNIDRDGVLTLKINEGIWKVTPSKATRRPKVKLFCARCVRKSARRLTRNLPAARCNVSTTSAFLKMSTSRCNPALSRTRLSWRLTLKKNAPALSVSARVIPQVTALSA